VRSSARNNSHSTKAPQSANSLLIAASGPKMAAGIQRMKARCCRLRLAAVVKLPDRSSPTSVNFVGCDLLLSGHFPDQPTSTGVLLKYVIRYGYSVSAGDSVSQTLPGDFLRVSESLPVSGELTRRGELVSIDYFLQEPLGPLKMPSINLAASVPIHLGRRLFSCQQGIPQCLEHGDHCCVKFRRGGTISGSRVN